jgi:hypothetical protein
MDDALDGDGAAHWPAARILPAAAHNNMRAAQTPALPLRPNCIRILRNQCTAGKKASRIGEVERKATGALKSPQIENARDRSLWRFNLDHSQYSRCCVLRLPQWPPSSFRWRCYLWLRWLSELRLASAPCTPARPVANLPARIGFVSFGSTGCKPPTCVSCSAHPLDLWRSIKLAPDDPGLPGLRPTILTPPSLRRTGPSSG